MTRRERQSVAAYLDKIVPLNNASHADVIDYTVTIPTRFAELRARLANGRSARLADSQQFLGWSGYGVCPTLLFACQGKQVVVATNSGSRRTPDWFIARDGAQIPMAVST